jgi:protein TonB
MNPNPNNDSQDIFKTGTTISEAPSWFDSLLKQIVERREERKHPRPQIQITAEKDPTALDKLVDMPSPVASLYSDIREAINDYLHPRKIETTAELVDVEEIWSKPPQPLSVFGKGSIVFGALLGLALIPWATSIPALPKANETAVVVYTPVNLIMPLKPDARDSGGGGGGGRKTLTPPSLGKLPRAADKQIVPPDPEPPKNPDPKLIVEPTVVAPQLANLPQINLLNIGDPNGVPGPPSAGPGVGGGIGTGQGRGIGEGKGPGVGPGEGGGTGGGVFRVGGGVSPPTVVSRVEPQYSEEARKARYQGTVVLEAIVRRDGTVDILRVVRSLGFGLDENAIQALKQWHFRPGMRAGVPVDVALNIEVNFNLR